MRVVVCGSYGDMTHFLNVLRNVRSKYGAENVFPTDEHLRESQVCIEAHHLGKGETSETLELRAKLMERYFQEITKAGLVVIVNEKNGMEHYGVGTTIELGYAFAKKRRVEFTKPPTNANILSLLKLEA